MQQKRIRIKYDLVYKTRITPFFPGCFNFTNYYFKELLDLKLKAEEPILAVISNQVTHWFFPKSLAKIGRRALDKFFSHPRYLARIKQKEKEISKILMRVIKTPINNLFQDKVLNKKGQNKLLKIFHYYQDYTYYVDILGFIFQLYYVDKYKKYIFKNLKKYRPEEKEKIFSFMLSTPRKTNYERFLFQLYNYLTTKRSEKYLYQITSKFYWLVHDYLGDIIDIKYLRNQIKEIKKKPMHEFESELKEVQSRLRKTRDVRKIIPMAIRQKVKQAQELFYLYNERKKELLNKVNIYLRQIVEFRFPKKGLAGIHMIFQLLPEEIINLLKGKEIKDLKQRSKAWVYGEYDGKISHGNLKYLTLVTSYNEIKILKGLAASPGHTQGIANVILNISHIQKFKNGNILIAPFTNINYLPIMRKAKAILTETGGLTSHAAIVSRELRIPCVVGIKNLLSILKDGDRISVDADKGVVKKL